MVSQSLNFLVNLFQVLVIVNFFHNRNLVDGNVNTIHVQASVTSHAIVQFAMNHALNVFLVGIFVSVFVEKSVHLFVACVTKQSLLNLSFMV